MSVIEVPADDDQLAFRDFVRSLSGRTIAAARDLWEAHANTGTLTIKAYPGFSTIDPEDAAFDGWKVCRLVGSDLGGLCDTLPDEVDVTYLAYELACPTPKNIEYVEPVNTFEYVACPACTRLYFTKYAAGDSGGDGGAGSEDAPASVSATVSGWEGTTSIDNEWMLDTTPPPAEFGGPNLGTWAEVSPELYEDIRAGQHLFELTGELLALIQAGGATATMYARGSSRFGTGISESGQYVISQLGIGVVSPDGSTLRGTALALHDLTSGGDPFPPNAAESGNTTQTNRRFPPAAASNTLAAVPSAQEGDYLLVEPGLRNMQASEVTGGGINLSSSEEYAGDLPENLTSQDDLRAWIEICG